MRNIKIALFIFTFILSSNLFAQPPGGPGSMDRHERGEKVEAMKVAFFTQRLNLSVEEAKVFWPVYDQSQKELKELRDKRREQIISYVKNEKELSEAEYAKIADNEIEFRQHELDIMKKYHAQFKTVISAEKLVKLYKSENDFKRELLRQIQDKNRKGSGRSPSNKMERN